MADESKSKLSQLEKALYAKDNRIPVEVKRHNLSDKIFDIKTDWQHDESVFAEPDYNEKTVKAPKIIWKILWGAVIFCLIAVGVAAYKFLGGTNMVSGNNIEVAVKAPVSIAAGQQVSFEIKITNNNKVNLLAPDLQITYPNGAQKSDGTGAGLKRTAESIGDMSPGQTVVKTSNFILFGEQNEVKNIDITIEYRVPGSNAIFDKTKTIPISISSAPVTININAPTDINTNQTATFGVELVSNSQSIINNLALKVDYPFGFVYKNSSQKPVLQNNVWLIGDMAPGSRRTITFSGVLQGQEGEERGFNFTVGTSGGKDQNYQITTLLVSGHTPVTIRRPFVSADLAIGGISSGDVVAYSGVPVESVVNWQNNLAYPVNDVSILVKMSGNDLDKNSIKVDGGFYRSIDNTIIFDKNYTEGLKTLASGAAGAGKFSFNSFSPQSVTGAALSNPTIHLDITVSGVRTDTGSNLPEILYSDSRNVLVSSFASLSAKALYYVGPFTNTGPIPPAAEKETTYTVTWTVTNSINNISGAKVVATLPAYVKWLGKVSPSGEKVSFDSATNQIVWTVGNMVAGTGINTPAREVSFQVSLTPSLSQVGESPVIVNAATLTAKDSFTGVQVGDSSGSLNTALDSDPYFDSTNGDVKP
ncbi:MAG: hypothetical protein WCO10_02360 [bacterium]